MVVNWNAVLNVLILSLLVKFIKLCIYIKCLKLRLKDSFKKKTFNLNLKDGLFVSFLKIEKKKLKHFS